MNDHIDPVMPSGPVSPRLAIVGVGFALQSGALAGEDVTTSEEDGISVGNICIRRAPPTALAPRWGMICHGVQFNRSY